MQNYAFATNTRPHCIWDGDLAARNLQFLDRVDPAYFEYHAQIYSAALENDDKDRFAAMGNRSGYFHGLESFFAVLGAFLQAPGAMPAWLLRYKNAELKALVGAIHRGQLPYPGLDLARPTWTAISEIVNDLAIEEVAKVTAIQGFARTWQGFASDFLDELKQSEYNSIKHGFRVRSGGFRLAIRAESSPGIAAPDAPWVGLGGTVHGTEFMRVEKAARLRSNFRLRNQNVNWSPRNMAAGLLMISMSMRNVIARARLWAGAPAEDCQFVVPANASWYAAPWRESVGVHACNMDQRFKVDDMDLVTDEEIVRRLSGTNG